MARDHKKGLDYFPLDTDMDSDPKVELLEAEFGIKGFGILIKLLMRIYGEGYYYEWNSDIRLLFAKKYTGSIQNAGLVDEVLQGSFKRGLLSQSVFESFSVLTSEAIQKRYLKIVNQLGRSGTDLDSRYWLLPLDPTDYRIPLTIDGKPLEETSKPPDETPQRKRKEKKKKEKKRNTNRVRDVEEIFNLYPRKVERDEALQKIDSALGKLQSQVDDPVEWLKEKVRLFAKSPKGQSGKYCPYPANWFEKGRYNDDPSEWDVESKNSQPQETQQAKYFNEFQVIRWLEDEGVDKSRVGEFFQKSPKKDDGVALWEKL